MTTRARPLLRADLVGGDPLGVGDEHVLSWQLPAGTARQLAYQLLTDDGVDSGRVESDEQLWVRLPAPALDTDVRVRVWTDRGESAWSEPVRLASGAPASEGWRHGWIGVAERERPPKDQRPAYWLRRTVHLDRATAAARVHVTALGTYELFLDGHRVGDEELAPGFTQLAARVQAQTHDLTGLLGPGPHVLAVLLADGWYRGQVGLPRAADQFGTDLALRVQVEVRDEDGRAGWTPVAGTDGAWRTATSHVLRADLIGGQGEDRRLVDPALHTAGYDDSSWDPAPARDVDVTVVRPVGPPVRRTEELRPVAVTRAPDGAQVVDLGQDVNGWVRLSRLGPAGTALTLRHGEHLGPDGDLTTTHLDVDLPIVPEPLPLGQVDQVVSSGVPGDVFEPRLTTHGFRYVRIEGHPEQLVPTDVTGVVVHSDLRPTGTFTCSDPRLDALHEAAVWSLRGNTCGIPTDCPQRERAGWTGDWQVFASTAAFVRDVLAFTRSWLRDVRLDQRADGCVANMSPCSPAEGFAGPLGFLHGSAGWGDVVVSAPWDLYQAYGDRSILAESWPAMTAWTGYAARAAEAGRRPYLWDSGFHWGEWLEPGSTIEDFGAFVRADEAEVATAYLHRSARTVAEVARVLGEDDQVHQRIADAAREAWCAEFVRADGTLVTRTQAAHVRALAFDLLPEDGRAPVADALAALVADAGDHLTTGFLSTGLLLPVLADHGHLDTAYRLLLQDTEPSWLTMVDRGATTVWERWDGIDAEGVAHDSLNHYSKGAVISFLHRHVAGLQPTSPGYRTFRVRPRPGGGLTHARATHECPYGRIVVAWQQHAGRFALDVAVPPGTTAEVVLPDGTTHGVEPGEHTF